MALCQADNAAKSKMDDYRAVGLTLTRDRRLFNWGLRHYVAQECVSEIVEPYQTQNAHPGTNPNKKSTSPDVNLSFLLNLASP